MKPTDNKWFTDAQLTALSQGYPPVEFDSEQTITRLALNLLSSRQTIKRLIEDGGRLYADLYRFRIHRGIEELKSETGHIALLQELKKED